MRADRLGRFIPNPEEALLEGEHIRRLEDGAVEVTGGSLEQEEGKKWFVIRMETDGRILVRQNDPAVMQDGVGTFREKEIQPIPGGKPGFQIVSEKRVQTLPDSSRVSHNLRIERDESGRIQAEHYTRTSSGGDTFQVDTEYHYDESGTPQQKQVSVQEGGNVETNTANFSQWSLDHTGDAVDHMSDGASWSGFVQRWVDASSPQVERCLSAIEIERNNAA